MKKYPKYKNTNIEWLEQIPEHWQKLKLKWIFQEIGSGTTPKSSEEKYYKNGNINWLLTGDLNDSKVTKTSKKITELATSDYTTLKLYPKNSIVMAMYGATIGKLGILDVETTVNQACCVIPSSNRASIKFIYFYLLSIRKEIINLSFGGGQPNISQEIIKNIYTPLPPLQEQKAIAEYLDKKTSEIDQIIEAKKKLIGLYNEEKTALINKAVTKGIDDKAKLKQSGVEWLGDIPQHWEVKKFRYLYSLNNNKSDKDLKKIALENIESKTGKLIDTNTEFAGTGIEFNKDDILFGKLRPYLAKVYLSDFHGEAVGDFYVFTPNLSEVNPIFSKYRILDYSFIDLVSSSTYGAKMPRASWDFISNLMFAVPPLKEQEKIVDYIEKNVSVIDKKVANAKRLIELMTEYRTTLISEVVTGKVKVV